jgi:hypothetical protein
MCAEKLHVVLTIGVILSAIPKMKTAESWPRRKCWSDRADRAVAANLIQTNAIIQTQLQTLSIFRRSIGLVATYVHEQDTDGWRHLGARVADYHRADGRLQQVCRRLGRRLDRLVINTHLPDRQSIRAHLHENLN